MVVRVVVGGWWGLGVGFKLFDGVNICVVIDWGVEVVGVRVFLVVGVLVVFLVWLCGCVV